MKRLHILFIIILIPIITLSGERNAFQYYYQGEYNNAHPMLLNLAKNNNSKALYLLAKMNLFGYGMKKNLVDGLQYMQRSAKANNLKAQMYLGAYYLHQKKNIKETLVWLQKAANQGNVNAQMFTALCYWYGLGTSKKPDTAKRYIILAAKNGIPMAQFLLATIFLKSRHTADKRMGRIWMSKATKKIDINELNTITKISLKNDNNPWEIMIDLLKKAKVTIENPKRLVAKNDEQTIMPILQSLPKNMIIESDFNLISPADLHMHDILVQVSRLDYQKQTQQLNISTYKHEIPEQEDNYQAMLQRLFRLAMHGNTKAMFKLSLLYENGYGVEQDKQKAFSLFLKTAKLNYLKSEYMVGVYYLNGWVVNKNLHTAMKWLHQAALHGNANAQLLLGNIYEYGLQDDKAANSIKKDITRAQAMYSLAAQNGSPIAQYRLAQMYTSGLFNPTRNQQTQKRDLQIAYRLYKSAAKAGLEKANLFSAFFYAAKNESKDKHIQAYKIAKEFAAKKNQDARLLLAILYDRGIGVHKNHHVALYIYRTLAKNNNILANFALGTYYYLDYENHKKAEIYLGKAAAKDIPYAQYNLALIAKNNYQLNDEFIFLLNKLAAENFNKALLFLGDYYLVNGDSNSDLQKAAGLYQKLAKKQNQDAELRLGYMYQNGIYFRKNMDNAFYWYQLSANHGNDIAQYQLGEIYFLGQGVPRNIEMALKYYILSAKQQFSPAMAAIGYIKAVAQFDYQNAKEWYTKAARLNDKQAQKNLRLLNTLNSLSHG